MSAADESISLVRKEKHEERALIEYVKYDLFPKVKFAYDKDDWRVGNPIFNDFVKRTKGKIGNETISEGDVKRLMEAVWLRGLTKNIQKNSLVQKRSAVYTVMMNKFADLCTLCVDSRSIMISLESITNRLEDPKAYLVFYDFFYKAAVGEAKWNDCLPDVDSRIGNDTTEAFALLVFINNYKSWLFEEKVKHGTGLLTEYDSIPSIEHLSVVDVIFDKVQLNLDDSSEPLILDAEDRTYKRLIKKRNDWLQELINTDIAHEVNEHVLSVPSSTANSTANESTSPSTSTSDLGEEVPHPTSLRAQRQRKRRKTQELRLYTGLSNVSERKFKGWSDEGMEAFERWIALVKVDVENGKCTIFEHAYREVMKLIGVDLKNDGAEEALKRYSPTKSLVWEPL